MGRYLVRQGAKEGHWMVWDRVRRGPAIVNQCELARLTQDAASFALTKLKGSNPTIDPENVAQVKWQLIYGDGVLVDCGNEQDAKRLARELLHRGYRVSAREVKGSLPKRLIGPRDVRAWLAD
jgi:hypothetical protein